MALVDTLLGGGLAIAGGVIGTLISGWQQRSASESVREDQRSSALRTAAAHYSQLAVQSINSTNSMIEKFSDSPGRATVDHNPILASDIVGALQELYLLSESDNVVIAASSLRRQVRVAFLEVARIIDSYDPQNTDIPADVANAYECLARAVNSRIEFLATVRKELRLKQVDPEILI